MIYLQTGQFHGQTNQTIRLDGATLTDTQYTQHKVDWHYHENAYFTFLLQGKVLEGNKKEQYTCSPGTLLFHNWQEPHYNIKPEGFTRGFHIELEQHWMEGFDLNLDSLSGSMNIADPDLKFLLYQIVRETKIEGATASLSIQSLLLRLLAGLLRDNNASRLNKPLWVGRIREILHEPDSTQLELKRLAKNLDIHPVHLSRDFPKYFHCNLGHYIRKVKVEKAMSLLSIKKLSLTDICFECGFADQSHFNRCFKEVIGLSPLRYRKLLFS